jgi:hypothetical protein
MSQARKALVISLTLAGLFELGMIPVIDVPAAAGVFALAFLATAAALYRRMRTPAAVIAVILFAVDGGGTPFYQRSSWVDWITQLTFAAICAVGVVSALAAIRTERRESVRVPTGVASPGTGSPI